MERRDQIFVCSSALLPATCVLPPWIGGYDTWKDKKGISEKGSFQIDRDIIGLNIDF
jgi:hypothetical protein